MCNSCLNLSAHGSHICSHMKGKMKNMKEFYNLLQLDPDKIKKKISESGTFGKKFYYSFVLAFRAAIIVAFAILFVSVASSFFGEDNSPMGVVLLVFVLTIRFVNFSYCLKDSLVTLAVFLLVMTVAPAISFMVPSWAVFFVHFIAFFIILCITTQNPRMGLGGLSGFAYVYLVGNAVQGEALARRGGLAVCGYILCAAIFIYKHRSKDKDVRFTKMFENFKLSNPVVLWQLRFALGIALILTIAQVLDIPRFMWMGFACQTMLAKYPYSTENTRERFGERVEGIAVGCTGFVILCSLIPESMYPMIGLLAGFFLGFCTTYRNKTIVICFSALYAAVDLYGVTGGALLRVMNNVMGAVIAAVFIGLYHVVIGRRFMPDQKS